MELATATVAMNLTFQILTHNMWCHYLTTAPNKGHRMHHFMNSISEQNYDVVLLQELFIFNVFGMVAGEDLRDYVSSEFRRLGYQHQAISARPPWIWGQTSGLLIYSKHPISIYEEKRWYALTDGGTGKGFMHALIKIHDQNVHFFNVHFDAHGGGARKEQLKSILEELPKPYSANNVIIAGDYNIDFNNTKEYNAMIEDFAPRELHDIYGGEYVATHQSGQNLDHILATTSRLTVVDKKVERFVDTKGEGISDHFGISATFNFNYL